MKLFIKYRIIFCAAFLITGIILSEYLQPGIFVTAILAFSLSITAIRYRQVAILLFLPAGMAVTPDYKPPEPLIKYQEKKVEIKGTLLSNPENRPQSTRITLDLSMIDGKDIQEEKARMVLYSSFMINGLSSGDVISVSGIRPGRIKNFNNPGVFDISGHYKRKNVFFSGFVNNREDIIYKGQDPSFNPVLRSVDRKRLQFVNFVRHNTPVPESEIINALTVGVKSLIPKELRDRFSALGISHIFAISGLHIGAIAFAFYNAFKWILKRSEYLLLKFQVKKISAVATIIPVFIYTALAGFSISAVRAAIMVTTYLLAVISGRQEYRMNSLAVAAILILLISPYSLFDLSFQLSFLAVTGILLIHTYYPFRFNTVNDKIISAVKATTAATFSTLPLTVNSFGYLPLSTLPANLLLVPVVEIIVIPLGLLSIITFQFSEFVTSMLLYGNRFIVSLMIDATDVFEKLDVVYYTFPKLNTFTITIYFLSGITFLIAGRSKQLIYLLPLFAIVIAAYHVNGKSFPENSGLSIHNLDAGYKNVTIIELPHGRNILVTGGYSRRSSSSFIEEAVIVPHLLSKGITRIEYLIVTSVDRSHINGLKQLLKRVEVENLWTNSPRLDGQLWEIIKEKQIKWKDLSSYTEKFTIEGVEFRFIKPRGRFMIRDYRYPKPLILKVTYRDRSFMTGESIDNQYVQQELAETYNHFLETDVLYIPGFKPGEETERFLALTGAMYIICKKCEIKEPAGTGDFRLMSTSANGMITTVSDGSYLKVFKYMN